MSRQTLGNWSTLNEMHNCDELSDAVYRLIEETRGCLRVNLHMQFLLQQAYGPGWEERLTSVGMDPINIARVDLQMAGLLEMEIAIRGIFLEDDLKSTMPIREPLIQ